MRFILLGVVEQTTIGDLISSKTTHPCVGETVSSLVLFIAVESAVSCFYFEQVEVSYHVREVEQLREPGFSQTSGGSLGLACREPSQFQCASPVQSFSSSR